MESAIVNLLAPRFRAFSAAFLASDLTVLRFGQPSAQAVADRVPGLTYRGLPDLPYGPRLRTGHACRRPLTGHVPA